MITETIDRNRWIGFLDRLSKGLEGKRAEISVVSLDLGSQIEAEWLPFLGMTYDRRTDSIEVILEGLEEIIPHPKQLSYMQDDGGIASVEIVDAQGTQHIVKLKEPLQLAPPGSPIQGA